MTPWFIDAIDARGGLAIVTQRQSDLKLNASADAGASVFISPPSFTPEFVGSRSIGFALARNRGQLGLFHLDDEVPFDSLAAVAEFVRRSYLRGAGGDGTGENGGSSPPPSPEGGEPPDEPTEGLRGIEGGGESAVETDPVVALLAVARINSEHSKQLPIGKSHPGESLPKPVGTARTADSRRRRLARGALRVLHELIRRRPNRQPDKLYWLATLEKLVFVLTRMALWPVIIEEFHHGTALVSWVYGKNYRPSGPDHWLYEFLEEYPRRGRGPWYWVDMYWATWSMTDTFDDLAVLPVPPRTVPFAPKDGQNLQALLSAASATPEQTLQAKNGALEQECAELALFAAACLNLGGEHSPHFWDTDSCVQFADRIAIRAQTWLGTNIPKFVYATDVENLIVQASAIPA
jgi:hypothetical protein